MTKREQHKKTKRALATHASLVHATESLAILQNRQLNSLGLTMSQFRLLAALLQHGPMTHGALCEQLVCSYGNTSFLFTELCGRGLIVRKKFEGNSRRRVICLTPEGHKLIAKVFPVHAALASAQMNVLSGRERETLARLCGKLGNTVAPKFINELVTVDAEAVTLAGASPALAEKHQF